MLNTTTLIAQYLNLSIVYGNMYVIFVYNDYPHCPVQSKFNKNSILCLWFRASLIYINNCPTRCNTNQSIYYSASSLYMFRVSTTSIIRSTQNCNYSLQYWSYFLCSYLPPKWPNLAKLEWGSCRVPETVVTVPCTPDDGCGWHPNRVEWTCRFWRFADRASQYNLSN